MPFTHPPQYPITPTGKHRLALAISALLAAGGLANSAIAGDFPAVIPLSTLDGSNGFRIDGVAPSNRAGSAVSTAGDINGDGFDDLLIGAFRASPNGNDSGSSYVVFGSSNPFSATLNLSSLDGTIGFRIDGLAAFDRFGQTVSAAGDVNGDGLDDLLIGAPNASFNENPSSGSSYVVFGSNSPFAATLDLSSLNGTTGFRIDGAAAYDGSGIAVSAAGDVNGDGLDDLLISNLSDSSYVVFGRNSPVEPTLNLGSLDGINGFRLDGEAADDRFGRAVSAAGDVNGDGLDDLLIGAPNADPILNRSGSSYVVFGSSSPFAATLAMSSLDGVNGFRLDGEAASDVSGRAVSGAGDINGDGLDDLLIGAPDADPNGTGSGRSYVVFGRNNPFAATLNLSSLNGTTGFRLDGEAASNYAGRAVSAAGDVNGDGLDDLLIGAYGAGPDNDYSGRSYVVFGSNNPFAATLNLSSLVGTTGFRIDGVTERDESGRAVSAAGDVNGDGVDDLLIAAPYASPNGDSSGSSYVVFGVRDEVFTDRFEQ